MAVRQAKRVASVLEAKGMERDENHHHMFRKQVDGVTVLVTRISHNAKEINDGLARLMGKQLVLSLKEFWELVDCSLDEEGWNELVADRCHEGVNPFLGQG
jgi:hypothetical protein